MEEFLRSLLRSLEQLEVRGRENLDIVLGCMLAIERVLTQIQEKEEGESDGG